MALKMRKNLPNGIDLPESYRRVINIRLEVITETIYIEVATYKDKYSRDNNLAPVVSAEYAFYSGDFKKFFSPQAMDNEGNIIAQAYKAVKSLPEFAEAIDQ